MDVTELLQQLSAPVLSILAIVLAFFRKPNK